MITAQPQPAGSVATTGAPPSPTSPPTPTGADNNTPQALSLAVLLAMQGKCECQPCQLLRKAVQEMATRQLQGVTA